MDNPEGNIWLADLDLLWTVNYCCTQAECTQAVWPVAFTELFFYVDHH